MCPCGCAGIYVSEAPTDLRPCAQVSISGTEIEFYEFDTAGQLVVKSKQSLQVCAQVPLRYAPLARQLIRAPDASFPHIIRHCPTLVGPHLGIARLATTLPHAMHPTLCIGHLRLSVLAVVCQHLLRVWVTLNGNMSAPLCVSLCMCACAHARSAKLWCVPHLWTGVLRTYEAVSTTRV